MVLFCKPKMKKIAYDITHHIFHYIILVTILLGGFGAFFSFRNYPVIQLLIGITTALSYALWGIMHHFVDRDLSIKIVIEYLAISAFAIIILWNVLIL